MMRFGGTGLPSTFRMNNLGTDEGTILDNISPLRVPPSHQQRVKRLRSLELLSSDSIGVYPAHSIHGYADVPKKSRNKTAIQDRRASRKIVTQEGSISRAEDAYGASDSESNLPKRRRRRGPHCSRTGSSGNQSVSQSFFDIEPLLETSIEPSSQNELGDAPDLQCLTCRRTYKTEEKLS
jgi:hypothetical protein